MPPPVSLGNDLIIADIDNLEEGIVNKDRSESDILLENKDNDIILSDDNYKIKDNLLPKDNNFVISDNVSIIVEIVISSDKDSRIL